MYTALNVLLKALPYWTYFTLSRKGKKDPVDLGKKAKLNTVLMVSCEIVILLIKSSLFAYITVK